MTIEPTQPRARVARAARPRSWPTGAPALAGVILSVLYVPQARADIWGYVDAERIPHFAPTKVDDRYELLLRDSVEPFQRAQVARPGQESTSDDTGTATPSANAFDNGRGLTPKMAAFFEQSKNYKTVSPLLQEASKTHGVDYSLLKAVIATESGFNPSAVSPKGAVGLMQVIPPTAARYGVTAGKNSSIAKKLTDPKTNIKAGARYLADLIRMFPGRLELALAAYNAGEGAVQRAGNKVPNYPETQNYVKTVMQIYGGLAPAKAAGGRVRVEMKVPTAAEAAVALAADGTRSAAPQEGQSE